VTLKIDCICDRCGLTVKPPANAGWTRGTVISGDGVNPMGFDGDFCPTCWEQIRKQNSGKRLVS
jgi:hypothetical protein